MTERIVVGFDKCENCFNGHDRECSGGTCDCKCRYRTRCFECGETDCSGCGNEEKS